MKGKVVRNLIVAIISLVIFSASLTHAHHEGGQQGTGVTITRYNADPNVVCLLFRDGKVAAINRGGQDVTIWLIGFGDSAFVVGGRMKSRDPEYGHFTLQLTCYQGTAAELLSGRAAYVMQRPVCKTAPIVYEYGLYVVEERYDFGSPSFPCYMER